MKSPRPDVPIPSRMAKLDRDPRGYPIPWTVFRDQNGRPHFTVNDEPKRILCLIEDRCPICGGKLMHRRWFAGGPRGAFHPDGAYADPPMHGECMRYSLRVCPYLAAPRYEGRIDERTVRHDEPARLYIDMTQIPERPAVFVAVLAAGQELLRPRFYVRPKQPFLRIEYWRGGQLLPQSEGERIVQTVMSAPRPALKPPRLLRAGSR